MTAQEGQLLMRLVESAARVEEAVKGLRRDFDDEKDHAHESRKDVHIKIDSLTERTAELEGTVKIVGQVAAQVRDVVDKKVMPVVDEFTAMKWRGAGMLSVAAIAGSILFWVLTTYGTKILAMFRISP